MSEDKTPPGDIRFNDPFEEPSAPPNRIGNYRILQKIGKGGMGVVWKAIDTTLDREVAIKILPPDFACDENRRVLFEREAKLLATLNHPNIVTIYSVEEAGGLHFITMELVPGTALSGLIPEQGFSLDRFVELAVPLVEAVGAAHDRGITHRDLKPDNVMVTDSSRLKVLDFGLAKLREEVSTDGDDSELVTATLTQHGKITGTLAYMSPEQARGKSLDERSDIFSLGIVLYEMATGERPFRGETVIELLSSIIRDAPREVTAVRPRLPRRLGRIIERCLAKDPARRFQTANELRNELGELSTGTSPEETQRLRPSIAVLPFTDMSPQKDQEYLCDGLAEDIINSLARIQTLSVAARTSAFSFKGKNVDVRDIGTALGVETILEGSVQKAGVRLRITTQLINVADGFHLWSERYDRQMDDMFAIQDEITRTVVERLTTDLLGAEQASPSKRYTDDLEAYEWYLKGRFSWNRRTAEGLNQGIDCFERALEVDPQYALAHVGLADCYNMFGAYGIAPPKASYPKAQAAALKALELDSALAEAHVSLAWSRYEFDWDWSRSEHEFNLAIELKPGYAVAHLWYAHLLMLLGRQEEASEQMQKTLALDPLSAMVKANIGYSLYLARHYNEALEHFLGTVETDPSFYLAHSYLGQTYLQLGRYGEAIEKFGESVTLSGNSPAEIANLGHAYAVSGDEARARASIDRLANMSTERYVPAFDVALIYTGLGEDDEAFAWLQKSYDERSYAVTYFKVEPRMDSLRPDPRFQTLLRNVGLAD